MYRSLDIRLHAGRIGRMVELQQKTPQEWFEGVIGISEHTHARTIA